MADWASALWTSMNAAGKRFVRIVYATLVWGVVLPLLTVCAAHGIFGGRARLPSGATRHIIPLTMNILLGGCLSLAGIALIYLIGFMRALWVAPPLEPPCLIL